MLLAIDIGNTNIVVGVIRDGDIVNSWRLFSSSDNTRDEYASVLLTLFRQAELEEDFTGAIISSVVPDLESLFIGFCLDYLGMDPLVVRPGIRSGLSIRYDSPRNVGADRIVNAVAALEMCKSDVIVIDFGTAITFDAVKKEGVYLGGAIFPGLRLSYDTLSRRTAKLPRISLSDVPEEAIGRSTVHSMQSGALYGYAALADGMVERFRSELGGQAAVLATGGEAGAIASVSRTIQRVVPNLTLIGLHLLHELNRGDS